MFSSFFIVGDEVAGLLQCGPATCSKSQRSRNRALRSRNCQMDADTSLWVESDSIWRVSFDGLARHIEPH